MTRLTKYIRNEIINNAVAGKKFKERDVEIVKRRAAFAEKMRQLTLKYFKLTDDQVLHAIVEIEHFQKKFSDSDGHQYVCVYTNTNSFHVNVNIGGQIRRIYRDGDSNHESAPLFRTSLIEFDGKLKTPYSGYAFPVGTIEDREELDSIDEEAAELREEYEALKVSLHNVLIQFNTVEKLVKAWPEVKDLLPSDLNQPATTGTGLALDITTLNSICGLPK